MDLKKNINLLKVAKELNIGIGTAVESLNKKGFKVEAKPTTKLTEEMYNALSKEYRGDRILREQARQIVIGKIRRDDLPDESLTNKKRALQIINKCIEIGARQLDLGACGLTSKDFASDEITQCLLQCSHIQELILSNQWTVWDENKSKWVYERSSNTGPKNYLEEIPAAIKSLVNLRKVICAGDELEWGIQNFDFLEGLKYLQYLDLSFNKLQSLDGIRVFGALETLIVEGNQINGVKQLYKKKSLRVINLQKNKISQIEALYSLKEIRCINLSYNQISSVKGFGNCRLLTNLLLNTNEIRDIKELSFILLKKRELYIEVYNNPFASASQLALLERENHFDFVKEVLQRSVGVSSKSTVSYPVKVLLLGNHGVGKSSLVDYFIEQASTGSTHVLRIANYFVNRSSSTNLLPDAIFFDFGGQDFYHGIYQAFLSRDALQLILFSESKNENRITEDYEKSQIVNYNLRYWLGQKTYQESGYDEKGKVIIIQTFTTIFSNINSLIKPELYEGYLRSFSISLHEPNDPDYSGYRDFYEFEKQCFKAFFNHILNKSKITIEEPNWYLEFLKYIFDKTDKDENPTSISIVLTHYRNSDLPEKERENSLITSLINLHRHGLVLFYPHIEGLEDVIWLNPEKLVKYVQEVVLNKKFLKSDTAGVVARIEFEELIKNERIVRLLEVQKVIFLHQPSGDPKDDEYILPNFLPIATADNLDLQLFTFGFSNPNFIIKFDDFIPFGFINQMICFFGLQPDIKKFWRNKLLFTLNKQVRVLIELDFECLKVSVKYHQLDKGIYTDTFLNEYLFFSLIGLYWGLSKKELFEFVEFVEFVSGKNLDEGRISDKPNIWKTLKIDDHYLPNDLFLSLDGENYANYSELFTVGEKDIWIRTYKLGQHNNIDFSSTRDVSVYNYQSFTGRKFLKMKKIFISYSKDDLTLVNRFIDHLAALRQDGQISSWYCTNLLPGQNWDDEIKTHFDSADIACFMVSPNFMRTKYIQDYEVKRAMERKREDSTFRIIPIILDFCRWTTADNNLGEFTALPYTAKPVLDFKNQNMAWYIIEECIRKMIELDDNPTGDDHFLDMKESFNKDVRNIFERISRGEVDF